MQNITIAGRVGKDAETRQAGSSNVTSFNVAVDQGYGQNKSTNWFRVSIWGQRGEKLAGYIRKGDNITVVGEFTLGEYDGKPQLNVNAHDVALQGQRGQGGGQGSAPTPAPADDLGDDVPW